MSEAFNGCRGWKIGVSQRGVANSNGDILPKRTTALEKLREPSKKGEKRQGNTGKAIENVNRKTSRALKSKHKRTKNPEQKKEKTSGKGELVHPIAVV